MINLDLFLEPDAEKIQLNIAKNVRNIRRRRKISQQKLAEMSGVSYGSIRRFEKTGEVSLASLVHIAMALDLQQELADLFADVPYLTMEEAKRDAEIY